MNSRSLNRRILLILLLFLCSAFFPHTEAGANGNPQPKGKKLPKIVFTDTVSGETMKYLGLSRERKFSLDDMKGSLFVIEIFSTYCTSCPRNVPILGKPNPPRSDWAGPVFWSRGYESTVWVTGKGLSSGVRLCGCRSEAVGRPEAAAQPPANSAGVRYPSEL